MPKKEPFKGTISLAGELEIDFSRGVIYFHANTGYTALRICRLPTPIVMPGPECMLDITHMHGASWGKPNSHHV